VAKYSFKSAGTLQDLEELAKKIERVKLKPIGIKTPVEKPTDSESSLFQMNFEPVDQIHENFRNMLLTNKGERIGRHDFGASLRDLTFDLISSSDFEFQVMNRIKEATEKYMPFIELENFTAEKLNISSDHDLKSMTKVEIIVEYNVPSIGVVKKPLMLVLYVGG
tara:strand:+ start:575 stop:1069 length:495 start_codon:yes stop_codon:yes gene_type:complete